MGAPVQPSVGSIHVPASVAAGGNDSSDCSRATPCQSFAGAYGKTAAGGVISCADYGKFAEFNFTITHSLTIDCDTGANVVSESGSGQIDVSTAAGDVVTLRGINIDGTAAVGSNRIMFSGAGVLNLERVNVRNNRNSTGGIQFFPTGAAKLFIAEATSRTTAAQARRQA